MTDEQVKLTVKLTRQLLHQLKVPYYETPAETETECAGLQALGIVDAVWSDDSDALTFRCDTLIQQHKTSKKLVQGHIRVYQAKALLEKHDLDPDSLVLFAVLAWPAKSHRTAADEDFAPHQPYSSKASDPTMSTPQLIPGDTIPLKTRRVPKAPAFLPFAPSHRPPHQSRRSNDLSISSSMRT